MKKFIVGLNSIHNLFLNEVNKIQNGYGRSSIDLISKFELFSIENIIPESDYYFSENVQRTARIIECVESFHIKIQHVVFYVPTEKKVHQSYLPGPRYKQCFFSDSNASKNTETYKELSAFNGGLDHLFFNVVYEGPDLLGKSLYFRVEKKARTLLDHYNTSCFGFTKHPGDDLTMRIPMGFVTALLF